MKAPGDCLPAVCSCLLVAVVCAALPVGLAAEQTESYRLFAPGRIYGIDHPPVYKVYPDGRIELSGLSAQDLGGGRVSGRKAPVVSPDQRWIAFIKDHNIWLYDVEHSSEEPVTEVGCPLEIPWEPVNLYIKAWSPDSKLLVYRVNHNEGPRGPYGGPPLECAQQTTDFMSMT